MSRPPRIIPEGTLEQTVRSVDRSVSRAWDGAVDAPYVTSIEQFEGFSHAEIHTKVQALLPRAIAEIAQRWNESGNRTGELFSEFKSGLRSAMEGWEGRSREAAEGASGAFSSSGSQLGFRARLVAPRLEEISHVASTLRNSIQPPSGNANAGVPLRSPADVIAQIEAANEARNQAIEAMNAVYKPTFQPGGVGDGVPAFLSPVDPAPGFGDEGVSVSSTGRSPSGGDPGTSSIGSEPYATDVAQQAADQVQPLTPQSETGVAEYPGTQFNPATQQAVAQQNPVETGSPEDFVRQAITTSSPPGTDTPPFTPDYRPGTPNVSAPVVSQNPSLPIVGPSTPNMNTNPVVAQSSPRPVGTRGVGGPGMMPGAAGARRQDDETEHKIPDYLITEENANALVGNLPKTAPPVLGVWDEKS